MASLEITLPPSLTGFNKPTTATHINPGGSPDGTAFLIDVGFGAIFLVVEQEDIQDALDEYADSAHAYLTRVAETEPDRADRYETLGNSGDPHDLFDLQIRPVNLKPLFGKIRTSYERWSAEDTEAGETRDQGWIDEQGEAIQSFHEIDRFIEKHAITEASGNTCEPTVWYSSLATNSGTTEYFEHGVTENRNYHLDGFAPETRQYFHSAVIGLPGHSDAPAR